MHDARDCAHERRTGVSDAVRTPPEPGVRGCMHAAGGEVRRGAAQHRPISNNGPGRAHVGKLAGLIQGAAPQRPPAALDQFLNHLRPAA